MQKWVLSLLLFLILAFGLFNETKAKIFNKSSAQLKIINLGVPPFASGVELHRFFLSLHITKEKINYVLNIFDDSDKFIANDIYEYDVLTGETSKLFRVAQSVQIAKRIDEDNILLRDFRGNATNYSLSTNIATAVMRTAEPLEKFKVFDSATVGNTVYELLRKENNNKSLFLSRRNKNSREPEVLKRIKDLEAELVKNLGNDNVYIERKFIDRRVLTFQKILDKRGSIKLKHLFEIDIDRFKPGSKTDNQHYFYKGRYYFDVSNFAKKTSKLTVLNPKTGRFTKIRRVKDATHNHIHFMSDAMYIRESLDGGRGGRLVRVAYKKPFGETIISEGAGFLELGEDFIAFLDRKDFNLKIQNAAGKQIFVIRLSGDQT